MKHIQRGKICLLTDVGGFPREDSKTRHNINIYTYHKIPISTYTRSAGKEPGEVLPEWRLWTVKLELSVLIPAPHCCRVF